MCIEEVSNFFAYERPDTPDRTVLCACAHGGCCMDGTYRSLLLCFAKHKVVETTKTEKMILSNANSFYLACILLVFAVITRVLPAKADSNINIRGWQGNREAKRLYDHLFSRYDRLIRPVTKHDEVITVKLGLKLAQLIAVDEVSQVVHFNMWVRHEWHDINLTWNASEFGGITRLYVPSEYLWIPDIVLHNNAEGEYNLTISTKATVFDSGHIIWEPPAIFKFHCAMSIEYFPYDEQNCTMKFGPWSHSGWQIDLKHVKNTSENSAITVPLATDLREYMLSAEWDILSVPGYRGIKVYACCPDEPYPELFFTFVLRRKPLFYTVTLIVPCVSISFLTLLVFYLPPDSRKKIELCKSILVSLTLFFLLLAELLPTTSLAVPLIAKYLMFTMALVSMSFIGTITSLNLIHSSPLTSSSMSPFIRKVFIQILPRILCMQRPLEMEEERMRKQHHALRRSLYNAGDTSRRSRGTLHTAASFYYNYDKTGQDGGIGHNRAHYIPASATDYSLHYNQQQQFHPIGPSSSAAYPQPSSTLHNSALPRPNRSLAPLPPIRLQYMPIPQQEEDVWVRQHENNVGGSLFREAVAASTAAFGKIDDENDDDDRRYRYGAETLTPRDFGYNMPPSTSQYENTQQTWVKTGGLFSDVNSAGATNNRSGGGARDGDSVLYSRRRAQREAPQHTALSWVEGPLSPNARVLCRRITFIADHIRRRAIRDQVKRDWKFVTVIIDRVFLITFTIVSLVGFFWIILMAPSIYDQRLPIPRKCNLERWIDSAQIPYDCMKRPELMH